MTMLVGPAALYLGWKFGEPAVAVFGVVVLACTAVAFVLAFRRPH